ncbi:hypothetical protein HJA90_14670 [Rhizobium bangladeshense]|uniref:hypothetical protein n=1 Tax=Rhizobium bangladeshense TaxID=1138189 RepID=UPI001C832F65|nr:hypothetical protein [Rhizobium bangladeshense]MBX4884819.1 hypothetical protein [Rhizobium bangladeshense]
MLEAELEEALEARSEQRGMLASLFRMLVGVLVGVVVIAGGVLLVLGGTYFSANTSTNRAASDVSRNQGVQVPQWPMLLAGSDVEAIGGRLEGAGKINPDFGELNPSQLNWLATTELTAAGYPLARIRFNVPACIDPFKAKEANEAWQSQDAAWMARLHGCYVLGAGLTVEWMSLRDPYHRDQTPVRLRSSDGARAVLYIPPISKERGILESPIAPISR